MRTPGTRTMAWLGLPAAALLAGGVGLAVASASPSHPPAARLDSASAQSAGRHSAGAHQTAGGPGCATPTPVPTEGDHAGPGPQRGNDACPGRALAHTNRAPAISVPLPDLAGLHAHPGPVEGQQPGTRALQDRSPHPHPGPDEGQHPGARAVRHAHPGTGAVRKEHPGAGADEEEDAYARALGCVHPGAGARQLTGGFTSPGVVARRCPGRGGSEHSGLAGPGAPVRPDA